MLYTVRRRNKASH